MTLKRGAIASSRPPAVVSDVFFNDLFDGAAGALTSHSPDLGGAWSHVDGTTNGIQLDGSGAVASAGGFQLVFNAVTPPDADYRLDWEWEQVLSGFSDGQMFIIARASGSGGSTNGYYYDNRGSQYRLRKRLTGTFTDIGTTYNNTPAAASVHTGALSVVGSAITGYVDGVQRMAATDSAITGAGSIAVFLANGRVKLRSLTATNV